MKGICIVFLLVVLSLATAAYGGQTIAQQIGNATSTANSLAGVAAAAWGSQQGIEQNISNPITSSGTLMTTLDKSKSFNAQLSCPSSAAFLSVLVQPASSGDLQTVIASVDPDMDGTPDYTYQIPVPVSGVCANGIISCNPGTWDNCQAYRWVSDSNLHVSAAIANITDLGGCYCINSSCGSNLAWNDLSIILNDLGGGIAGALQAVDSQLSVSQVKINGPEIFYYGQHPGACGSVNGGTGTSSPQQYFNNWPQLQADTRNAQQTQATDPNSYYNLLATSPAATNSNTQLSSCTVTEALQCSDSSPGYVNNVNDQCQALESNSNCILWNETVDGVQTMVGSASSGLQPLPPACDSVTVQQISQCSGFQGSASIGGAYVQFAPSAGGAEILINDPSCGPIWGGIYLPNGIIASGRSGLMDDFGDNWRIDNITISGQSLSATQDAINFSASNVLSGQDCGGPTTVSHGQIILTSTSGPMPPLTGQVTVTSNNDCRPMTLTGIGDQIQICDQCNGCGYLTLGSTCPLGSQYACVTRASAGIPSGSSINGTDYICPMDTSNGSTNVCFTPPTTYTVCPDFSEEDRTYECVSNPPFDFSAAQKRFGNVANTTKDNTTSMYYQDLTPDSSGNWTTSAVNSGLGVESDNSTSYGDCEQACKTEKPATNTQAAEVQNASQVDASTAGYDFFYKPCVLSGGNYTCPIGPGETIVTNCQCLNEFGEAASLMQSMRMAGQDMICSNGTASPFK